MNWTERANNSVDLARKISGSEPRDIYRCTSAAVSAHVWCAGASYGRTPPHRAATVYRRSVPSHAAVLCRRTSPFISSAPHPAQLARSLLLVQRSARRSSSSGCLPLAPPQLVRLWLQLARLMQPPPPDLTYPAASGLYCTYLLGAIMWHRRHRRGFAATAAAARPRLGPREHCSGGPPAAGLVLAALGLVG